MRVEQLDERKRLTGIHREIQKAEGSVISREIAHDREIVAQAFQTNTHEVWSLRDRLQQAEKDRNYWKAKAKRRSLLELLLGVNR